MTEVIFEFCKVIIALIFAVGFVGIVPAIKKYVDSVVDEKQQEKVKKWAVDTVDWAKDLLQDEDGAAKLAVGKEVMRNICDEFGIKITDKQIDILLRAGYQQMLRIEGEEDIDGALEAIGYYIPGSEDDESDEESEESSI